MTLRSARSALLVGAAAAAMLATGTAAAAETATPLLDGLSAPLGLAVARDGTLYVAQAFGEPAVLTQYRAGVTSTVAGGGVVTGVDALGRGTTTFLADGQVKVVTPSGTTTTLADLWAYEAAVNPDADSSYGLQGLSDSCRDDVEAAGLPDEVLGAVLPRGGLVDANPYAVAIMPDGERVVADAAANALVGVSRSGQVRTVAVLPPRPSTVTADAAAELGLPGCTIGLTLNLDFVPTDVELGPDGLLYVSSLPGGPDASSPLGPRGGVFTVERSTGSVQQVATGLDGATDLAVTPQGDVFVTELFGGRVSKVSAGGLVELVAELDQPVAIEYFRGTLYVARGVFGPGQVVTLVP